MKGHIYAIWIYAALLLIGGLMGFIKAGSVISLLIAALLALLLFKLSFNLKQGSLIAHRLILSTLFIILAFFGYRFIQTYNMMPAGLMLVLTASLLTYLMISKSSRELA